MADAVTDGITMIVMMVAETEAAEAEEQDVCRMIVAVKKQDIPATTVDVFVTTVAVRK